MENYLNNLFNLQDKVAIITGGAGLLGSEYAKGLLACGAKVALVDVDHEKINSLVKELKEKFSNDKVLGLVIDVSKKDQVEKMVKDVILFFGKVDILINNAGISGKFDNANVAPLFEDYPIEEWERAFAVNVSGMFLCAQAVGREMVKSGGGAIVNVSSIYGIVAPDQRMYNKEGELKFVKPVSYSVTKSAILNFTRYLAAYWGSKNIRVNTLTPGGVFDNQEAEFVKKYNNKTPLGRMANPDDMVGPMLFLVSDASKYMTGANLVIDGGWVSW